MPAPRASGEAWPLPGRHVHAPPSPHRPPSGAPSEAASTSQSLGVWCARRSWSGTPSTPRYMRSCGCWKIRRRRSRPGANRTAEAAWCVRVCVGGGGTAERRGTPACWEPAALAAAAAAPQRSTPANWAILHPTPPPCLLQQEAARGQRAHEEPRGRAAGRGGEAGFQGAPPRVAPLRQTEADGASAGCGGGCCVLTGICSAKHLLRRTSCCVTF